MPYRRGGRYSSMSVASPNRQATQANRAQKNYVSQQSGAKRHQYQSLPVNSPLALAAGEYFVHRLARFVRGTTAAPDDTPPSPTASNNYQTPSVMNGSKIVNYNTKISIKNRGAVGGDRSNDHR